MLRYLLADSRGARGRLLFFALCLAVGVAAVVAVAALADGLEQALRREARVLLGADLAVGGNQPIPDFQHLPELDGALRAGVRELATMASSPAAAPGHPASQLVELKVVDGPYPLYGQVQTSPAPLTELLSGGGAVVAPSLLSRLGLEVGDPLRIGDVELAIAGIVELEPDRTISPFSLGPRVFLDAQTFAATGLETFGSRIGYRHLWRLPGDPSRQEVERAAAALRGALDGSPFFRVEGFHEAQPTLRQGLRRVERYLGLVALLSLLVGGVGVAQSIRAFLASRLDAVAILQCLGMRPREALALHLSQVALLGLAGALVGSFAGLLLQLWAPLALGDLVPADAVRFWQPAALLRGLGLGLAASLLFGVPPVLAVLRVPPLRALRREVEPTPLPLWARLALAGAVLVGVWALAAAQGRSVLLGAQLTAGLAATLLLLLLAARWLHRAAAALRLAPVPVPVRQGAALLSRPGGDTLAAVAALGLGVLVVLTTLLVQQNLTSALEADLPAEAPTAFLVDVQPEQWPGVQEVLTERGASSVDSVPVITARLARVDGVPVEVLSRQAGPDRQRRWALTREQRLTYLDELPPDNHLVAGALWQDPDRDEVSLEEGFAQELGVGLGSTLTFDVQGIPFDLTVTSLRAVDWRTFRINFFVVVEPGVLDEAPQARLAAARLPRGEEQRIQDLLADRYPNVTLVDVRQILETFAAIFRRLGTGVRFLGAFTAAAGLAILFGAVAAGSVRRARELALLESLGFTRLGAVGVLATELTLTGLVAGLIGAAGASFLAWGAVTRGMELDWQWFPWTLAGGLAATTLLTLLAGLAASWRALRQRPIEVLREVRA
jgi:putative ABC transport system permease protein